MKGNVRSIISIIYFISIVFVGCENHSENDAFVRNSTQNHLTSQPYFVHEYGVAHNELLDYLQKNLVHNNDDYFTYLFKNDSILFKKNYYDETLNKVKEFFINKGFTYQETVSVVEEINNIFLQTDLFVEVEGDYYLKDIRYEISNLINSCKNHSIFSELEFLTINEILSEVENNNLIEAVNMIENINLSNFDYHTVKSPFIITSVLSYSKDYWNAELPLMIGYFGWFNEWLFATYASIIDTTASTVSVNPYAGAIFSQFYIATVLTVNSLLEPPCFCPVCSYYN